MQLATVTRFVIPSLVLVLLGQAVPTTSQAQSCTASQGPPGSARTCNPSDGDRQEAIALFSAGQAAVDSLRWADAIHSFERAYALSCAPSALFNLGIAFRALGRHREARDTFARLLANHPSARGELLESASSYCSEVSERLAILQFFGADPALRPEIHFDGREIIDHGERPLRIEADAGSHSFVARIPDHQPFVWNGDLVDGQAEDVMIRFLGIEQAAADWPIYVAVITGSALLVGGAIAAGIVLQNDAQVQPLSPDHVIVVLATP